MMTQRERDWIEGHFGKLNDRLTEVRIEIAKLKIKAGIWGIIGGAIPVLIIIGIYFFARR